MLLIIKEHLAKAEYRMPLKWGIKGSHSIYKDKYQLIFSPGRSEKSRMHSLKPLAKRRSLSCCKIATPIQKGKEELPNSSVSHRWKILCSGNTSVWKGTEINTTKGDILQNVFEETNPSRGGTIGSCKWDNSKQHAHSDKKGIILYIISMICMCMQHLLNMAPWL